MICRSAFIVIIACMFTQHTFSNSFPTSDNSIEPSQNENINTSDAFPDTRFRRIVESFMGVPQNGRFTARQAAEKTGTLDCKNSSIDSLKGVEYFTNIDALNCSNNNLKILDLSRNTGLEEIRSRENDLDFLNIDGLERLKFIDCVDNKLTTLNLRDNIALEYVYASDNLFREIDVSNNPDIIALGLGRCMLESIDISYNVKLKWLICGSNPIRNLDLRYNPLLTHLLRRP